MRTIQRGAALGVGALLLASIVYLVLAMPGLLSDRDSTVPSSDTQEAHR